MGRSHKSDKHITENCGFLEKLLPGDLVMADRGFTISESVGLKQAKLVIPVFTKGLKQLDPIDVEETRGIANVRIHQGLEGGVLIPHSRPFFARIPHPARFSSVSRIPLFFPRKIH